MKRASSNLGKGVPARSLALCGALLLTFAYTAPQVAALPETGETAGKRASQAAVEAIVDQSSRLATKVRRAETRLASLRDELTALSASLVKLGRDVDAKGRVKDLGCVYRGLAGDIAQAVSQGETANRARLLHALDDAHLLVPLAVARDAQALATPKSCPSGTIP